jgi:ketosteroid isomerase-like protein
MEAFNRRDLEAFLTLTDPAMEFYAPQTAASVGRNFVYRGHEGMTQFFRDVEDVWENLELSPQEFHSSNQHVVVVGTVAGERQSGHLDTRAGWAWKLRDGKAVWGRAYETPEDAFRDVGITEPQSD